MIFRSSLVLLAFLLLIAPVAIAQETISKTSNATLPPRITPVEKAALDQNCVATWECREFSPGQHYYGCYYEPSTKDCRCYAGDIALCKNDDIRCAFEFECKQSALSEGYNYDCTFDRTDQTCQCFTGDFAQCRQEVANPRALVAPEPPAPLPPPPAAVNESIAPPVPPADSKISNLIIAGAIMLILVVGAIAYATMRPSHDNLLRKARALHRKAELAHEEGHEDEAKEYLAQAERARKAALRKRSA